MVSEGDGMQRLRGRTPTGTDVFLTRFVRDDNDDLFLTVFLDELRYLTRLDHPNFARLIDVASAGQERFLVHEFVDGIVLRDTPPLDRDVASWIVAEACAGLHAAHELDVVHRDVKPANVMIARDGTVKLIDISLAKLINRRVPPVSKHTGMFRYMSPEQCLGKVLDRRSDIWSLGVMLYELCAHRWLFQRNTEFEVFEAIVKHPVPPLGENFAPALEAIVMTALERNPDDRYATALEMRDALLAVIGAENRRAEVADAIARL